RGREGASPVRGRAGDTRRRPRRGRGVTARTGPGCRPRVARWIGRGLILLLGVLAACGARAADARECLKVEFPDQVVLDGQALALNGLGLRRATMLGLNVYVAGLYVPKPSADPAALLGAPAPWQLVLHFVRSVGRSDLNKGWDEGFTANAREQLPALKGRIEKFESLMTDVKSGERLVFSHRPGAGLQVAVGGAAPGTIDGDDFARAHLSIWLGPQPPNASLKAGLLGGPCG